MGHKQLSTRDVGDVTWLCRHLAAALQDDATILQALDTLLPRAPSGPKAMLQAMRQGLVSQANAARGLTPLGLPSFVWGTILSGELHGTPGPALTKLADYLDGERQTARGADSTLRDYSCALGRIGLMLQVRVPLLQALESAAESAALPDVREAILAACDGIRDGADLSEVLSRVTAAIPAEAVDIIRDAELAGRLAEALPVVADYLLDEAVQKHARGGR
jgi:type II secretory pathway component PulF